ncbi:MAG: glycine cleavage T C-terminal barrel domain-containing protein [Verrucomicrobiota bacterium]
MTASFDREFHLQRGAALGTLNGATVVSRYDNLVAEHGFLRETAGVLDLSFRSRICLTGSDRTRFLHGQVTNDVARLKVGEGCYAAVVNAKGKMESDLNIFQLDQELLLDFEPGLTERLVERFNKFIIADDVQVVDVGPHYGLISVQGPKAADVFHSLDGILKVPDRPWQFTSTAHPALGEIVLAMHPRLGTAGFDLFVPVGQFRVAFEMLVNAAGKSGGGPCGWDAFEVRRIEEGIPRFGADMDETNLPPEAELENRAISYSKGCYIGQEIIARIRTYGQVAKTLRGLRFLSDCPALPGKGTPLFKETKEIGYITSAVRSLALNETIGLGYVRREANEIGTELHVRMDAGDIPVRIAPLPFTDNQPS